MSFALPERLVVNVLSNAGMTAGTKYRDVPAGFVRIVAVGGSKRTIALSQRMIQLFAYAATEPAAAALCEQAVSSLVAARFTYGITDVSVMGEPSYNPDPDTARPRYSATVSLLLRAQ